MEEWTDLFNKKLSNQTESYNFIAHSLGSLVTMKLIERHNIKVKNMVLVACPVNKIELHQQLLDKIDDNAKTTFTKFVEHKYNWDLIKSKVERIIFFFSDDDFAIPYKESISYYQKIFPDATFKTFNNYGHFNRKSDIFELPEVLDVLEMKLIEPARDFLSLGRSVKSKPIPGEKYSDQESDKAILSYISSREKLKKS